MRTTLRATLAAACAAGAVAAPSAAAIDTVIRVEGATANLLPESAIPIEGSGTATVFDRSSAPVEVDRASAFWQLYRATSASGLGLVFEHFPAFDAVLVQRVGPDENAGSVGWQYRVNRRAPAVGANAVRLADGDRVLWHYGAGDGARELDLALSSDRVRRGEAFTVTVASWDDQGRQEPGAGALVRYGGASAVADGAGHTTFVGQGAGALPVSATRAGDVRSPERPVCVFEDDPTVCNLPAEAPAPAAGQAAAPDRVAPGSRVTFPRIGSGHRRVRALRGVAGPDRSDVARVEVALARRVGTLCRFRARSGGLTTPRPCSRQLFVRARSAGGNWLLPLGRRGLAPGLWRVWSRAVDGADNRESVALARVNTGQFRVLTARQARAAARGSR